MHYRDQDLDVLQTKAQINPDVVTIMDAASAGMAGQSKADGVARHAHIMLA